MDTNLTSADTQTNEDKEAKFFSPEKAEKLSVHLMELMCGSPDNAHRTNNILDMHNGGRVHYNPLSQRESVIRRLIALLFTDENGHATSFPVRSPEILAEAADQFRQKIQDHNKQNFYGVLRLAYATFYTDEERLRYALPAIVELPWFESEFSDNISRLLKSWGPVDRGSQTAKALLGAYREQGISHASSDFLDEEDVLQLKKYDNHQALLTELGGSINNYALSPFKPEPGSDLEAKYSREMEYLKKLVNFELHEVPLSERASVLLTLGETVLEQKKRAAVEDLSENQKSISEGKGPRYDEEVVKSNLRISMNDVGESILVSAMAIDLPEEGKRQVYDFIAALPDRALDVAPLIKPQHKIHFCRLSFYAKRHLQPDKLSASDYEAYADLLPSAMGYPRFAQAMLHEMAQSCLPEGERTRRAMDNSIANFKAYVSRYLLKPKEDGEIKVFAEGGYDGQDGYFDRQMKSMAAFLKDGDFSESDRLKFLTAMGTMLVELEASHPDIDCNKGFNALSDCINLLRPAENSSSFQLKFIEGITAVPFIHSQEETRLYSHRDCYIVSFLKKSFERAIKETDHSTIVMPNVVAKRVLERGTQGHSQLVMVFKKGALVNGGESLVFVNDNVLPVNGADDLLQSVTYNLPAPHMKKLLSLAVT